MRVDQCCGCYINPCVSKQRSEICIICLFCAETGDFLNCEGSGLFLLQSSCKCWWCLSYENCYFRLKMLLVWAKRPYDNLPWHTHTQPYASLTSAGNHSCIPNAEVSFPDNNFLLHLSALCDINQGEVSWHVWVLSDKFWPEIDCAEHLCAPLSGGIRRLRL